MEWWSEQERKEGRQDMMEERRKRGKKGGRGRMDIEVTCDGEKC